MLVINVPDVFSSCYTVISALAKHSSAALACQKRVSDSSSLYTTPALLALAIKKLVFTAQC